MPSVQGLDGSLGPVGLHARLTRPRNYEEMPQTREQVQGLNGNHAFDGLLSSTALLAWVLTASKASNAVAAIMVRSPMRMSASSPPVYSNLSTTWRQEKRERERESSSSLGPQQLPGQRLQADVLRQALGAASGRRCAEPQVGIHWERAHMRIAKRCLAPFSVPHVTFSQISFM